MFAQDRVYFLVIVLNYHQTPHCRQDVSVADGMDHNNDTDVLCCVCALICVRVELGSGTYVNFQ